MKEWQVKHINLCLWDKITQKCNMHITDQNVWISVKFIFA